jgi:hypothetical protein
VLEKCRLPTTQVQVLLIEMEMGLCKYSWD